MGDGSNRSFAYVRLSLVDRSPILTISCTMIAIRQTILWIFAKIFLQFRLTYYVNLVRCLF